MIKCIAIDDSPAALDVIRIHAAKVPFLDLLKTFRSPLRALEFIGENPVALVFLDINMPEISGTRFARALPDDVSVIFTTAYPEYAVEGFELDAVDYLCKPIEFDRFLKAVGRLRRQPDKSARHVLIKSGANVHKLNVEDILYLKSEGSYVQFVTRERKILALMTMRKALDSLRPTRFVQVHRSYSVAWDHIDTVEKDAVRIDRTRIPIGKTYRDEVSKMIGSRAP